MTHTPTPYQPTAEMIVEKLREIEAAWLAHKAADMLNALSGPPGSPADRDGVSQEDCEAARTWLEDVCGKHLANDKERQMLAEAFRAHRLRHQPPAPVSGDVAEAVRRLRVDAKWHRGCHRGDMAVNAERAADMLETLSRHPSGDTRVYLPGWHKHDQSEGCPLPPDIMVDAIQWIEGGTHSFKPTRAAEVISDRGRWSHVNCYHIERPSSPTIAEAREAALREAAAVANTEAGNYSDTWHKEQDLGTRARLTARYDTARKITNAILALITPPASLEEASK